MDLQYWLNNYILDPFNPKNNFNLGLCYEEIGQTASAAGYYLRSVEFGNDDDQIYEGLLRMSLCFERQGSRVFTTKGVLLRAISLLPKRPEAYFLLARTYERSRDWQETYTLCTIAPLVTTDKPRTLTDVEYPGEFGFVFEKAIVAWWIGLMDESLHLWRTLKRDYNLPLRYKTTVEDNLKRLDTGIKEPILYNKAKYEQLKYKFKGVYNLKRNYSQCYQDFFVLTMLDGKRNGTYLEIGSADPFHGNNTALLERDFEWKGISIDIDAHWVEKFGRERSNTVIQGDATKLNYSELIPETIVDYLQVDCDPPTISYEVLQKIPFHTHKFAVITFEHDYYADPTQSIRDKSRKYLESFGYKLVVSNIAPDQYSSYEDWWVHPDLVDSRIVEKMEQTDGRTKKAEDYMLGRV